MLQMVYFAHFFTQISYGINFWSLSSSMRNVVIFQKRALRIILILGPRSSCREVFKKLEILTVPCLYIYALILFAVTNLNPYPTAFPYGNGMVLHFYQQQESGTTKTVHKVINKALKTYV